MTPEQKAAAKSVERALRKATKLDLVLYVYADAPSGLAVRGFSHPEETDDDTFYAFNGYIAADGGCGT